ncbi:MAG: Gx transporter family protein [Oscillospiraceae bacterium]|jgi:heptaprenyl diphosphate synthase|nr:Gx transporter family protein [Oscillospiraceae bacterium]
MNRTKSLAEMGLLIAVALVLSRIESFLPPPVPSVPGIKLGLANLPTVILLYDERRFPRPYISAITLSVSRVLLAGFMFSGLWSTIYALSGAAVSFFIMLLCKLSKKLSLIGVSIAGGTSHNLAQLAIAAFVMAEPRLLSLYPVLIISGIAAGFLVGITARLVDRILCS